MGETRVMIISNQNSFYTETSGKTFKNLVHIITRREKDDALLKTPTVPLQ
jgi:hypothetical protein